MSGRYASIVLATVALALAGSIVDAAAGSDVSVSVDLNRPLLTSRFELGATYMHYTLDSWGNAAAVANGKGVLGAAVRYHNQHIMGFGADNPEPSPGVYNWGSLDARMQTIRSMGGTPVFTLCCAPTWMVDPSWTAGTDWSKLEWAPLPQRYTDFANLARQVALRYPDVKYFQVWNEFKGLWSPGLNNWDYIAYTRLYNLVYDAVKSANPSAQVGGPYLVIEGTCSGPSAWWASCPITARNNTVLDYWLAHKHGADFIAVDRKTQDGHDPSRYTPAQLLAFTQTFHSVTQQLRAKTSLPVWWSENYFVGSSNWTYQAAGMASMLFQEVSAGASVSLLWEPQAPPGNPYGGNNENLFSNTLVAGGGQPYPTAQVYRDFHQYFGPGTQLYAATSSSPFIEVLASAQKTMLINLQPDAVQASVNGVPVALSGYQVMAMITPVPSSASAWPTEEPAIVSAPAGSAVRVAVAPGSDGRVTAGGPPTPPAFAAAPWVSSMVNLLIVFLLTGLSLAFFMGLRALYRLSGIGKSGPALARKSG